MMTPHDAERLGDYALVRLLATGGMAEVYLAHDRDGRELAVKVLRDRDDAARDMFRDEAQIGSLLAHPGFARVHAYGRAAEVDYLAMDLVRGIDLRGVRDRARHLPAAARHAIAIAIVAAAAETLDHAHRARDEHGAPLDLVHRDISLSNLMVTDAGEVKVIDFGIASVAGASRDAETETVRGKAAYMAPEQCVGRTVDVRTDVWSLGVVLYELATGQRCFPRDCSLGCMLAVIRGDYAAPTELDPLFPPELERVICTALQHDPAKRYASAAALAAALTALPVAYSPAAARAAIASVAGELGASASDNAPETALETAVVTRAERPIHVARNQYAGLGAEAA
jgi:serine/threonine protein kinase